jgi:N-hydroxyarylamine O-acetyltransferase
VSGAPAAFAWDEYADRVGLAATPRPDETGLHDLHRAQFHAIPFENLDIQLGREIGLSPAELCTKLVRRRRGGYCFELNGLLLLALRHLGFTARPLLARVHLHGPPTGRTHQLNAVTLGDRTWLLDAGFGAGGPRRPMLLEDGWEATGDFWGYRLERRAPWGWLMSSREDGAWRESYSFDLGHVEPGDIAVANYYTSHAPDVHFTRLRVVSRPTADGRISLRNQLRTRLFGGETLIDEIPPGPPTLAYLADEFGIVLDADFADFRPVADS